MRRFILLGCTLSAAAAVTATSANAASARPPAEAPRQDPIVTYTRTGGFAGLHDTVTVDATGVAHISSGQATISLSTEELDGLRADLDRIRTWWSSPAGCDIADHIAYSITYGDRRARRCHVVPGDWRPAVARLDGLLARVRPVGPTGA
ncbi:hypothetical protein AB0L00_02260 [Actinoallomurus sp. NPDC052308]|uniref:hypothetical protein n=1 Tax=Actinoallomurus sp. NPDC052308 TaxID=3155530 RepID=UPI0034188639